MRMRCHLVLDNNSRGWIIEKMCRRLGDELSSLGCNVSVGESADQNADVNHFTLFYWMPPAVPRHSTVAITHVDDVTRLELARSAIRLADLAICMSSMTVKQLVTDGNDRKKLCFILPAVHEGLAPRKIVIGITSKVYPDGRKREALLERLATDLDLSAFRFDIWGSGWEPIAYVLSRAGAEVSINDETGDPEDDYRRLRSKIPFFDYYLYLGLDEGSLGTLDALAAGVSTIVTPQGFHLDLPHGITHAFWDYAELRSIFRKVQEERNRRVSAVQSLTWKTYAEKHILVWREVIADRRAALQPLLQQESLVPIYDSSDDLERKVARLRRAMLVNEFKRVHLPRLRSLPRKVAQRYLPKLITNRILRG